MKQPVLLLALALLAGLCLASEVQALSGSSASRAINTLPYNQDFEGITPPALPSQWQGLITPTGSDASLGTDASDPHSGLNCIRFEGGYNGGASLYLIAPQLADSISIQSTRVRLWLKAVSFYQLQLGVMEDPADPAGFTLVNTLSFGQTWTERNLDLTNYSGTGRYIALRALNMSISSSLLLDDFRLERIWPVDLAAIALNTDTTQTPQAGHPSNFQITVQNLGSNLQSSYHVQLCNAVNDQPLASAMGYNIQPGQIWNVFIAWTPPMEGTYNLYAKVGAAGDADLSNNQSPNLQLEVISADTFNFTIGAAGPDTPLDRIPMDFYWKNTLFETIFLASEFQGHIGYINQISFHNHFTEELQDKPTKIWLGYTNSTSLSQGWLPAGQLTLVFDGVVDYPFGDNLISITLPTPFLMNPVTNLAMMVQRPMDTSYYGMGNQFRIGETFPNRSRKANSDTQEFNPYTPPTTSTLMDAFPVTTFQITLAQNAQVSGIVTGLGGIPVSGANLNLNNGTQTTITDANGYYQFNGLESGFHQISLLAVGYQPQEENFALDAGQQLVLNISLIPMPTVNVTGTVMASDTGAPLSGAGIVLSGYADFSGVSGADGTFLIPDVFATVVYNCQISAPGYGVWSGPIAVGDADFDIGTITLNEFASPPTQVNAALINEGFAVQIGWQPPNTQQRPLEGYKVWRIPPGQEPNPHVWMELTPNLITELSYIDTGWTVIPNGNYRWAIRSVYTGDVHSEPAITDTIFNSLITGFLAGTVRQVNTAPVVGATITAGPSTTSTNYAGAYNMIVPIGTYNVTASAPGYISQTVENISIGIGQTVSQHFVLLNDPSPVDDPVVPILTELKSNYPNPFNPSTTIAYALSLAGPVRIAVYNLKGQMVRELIDAEQASGTHKLIFDGLDNGGRPLGSGVYLLRMQTGDYQASLRMLLLK